MTAFGSWVLTWKGALAAYGTACVLFTVGWVVWRRPACRAEEAEQRQWRFIDDDDVAAVIAAAEYMCAVDAEKRRHPSWPREDDR